MKTITLYIHILIVWVQLTTFQGTQYWLKQYIARPRPGECFYLERQYVVAVVSPEGAVLHPRLWGEGTGSWELGWCYNVAAIGLFHGGDGVQGRGHPDTDSDSNPDTHRSARVPARLQPAPRVGGCAPSRVLVIIPSGRRTRRRRRHFAVIHNGLISVSLGEGALVGADRGSPLLGGLLLLLLLGLLLVLLGLGSQTHLRGEIPPEHRVDMMGEVLEKHRPIHRGYSLEKAVVHGGVSGSRGPSAPVRGGRGGQGAASLRLRLVVIAQPGQDRRLHRHLVPAVQR